MPAGHGRQVAERRATRHAVHRSYRQARQHHRPDQLRARHGRAILVNPQMYDVMNGATREIQALLKDICAIPRNSCASAGHLFISAATGGQCRRFRVHSGCGPRHPGSASPGNPDRHDFDGQWRAFDDAVRLAREMPSLDVGCHLVLIVGRSPCHRRAAAADDSTVAAGAGRPLVRVYDELAAQVRQIVDGACGPRTWIRINIPTWRRQCRTRWRAFGEFEILWVRRPFDFPLTGQRGGAAAQER